MPSGWSTDPAIPSQCRLPPGRSGLGDPAHPTPVVAATLSAGTCLAATGCEDVVVAAAERARKKRPGSDARSPRENCVAALWALFERARRAKYVFESPAAELNKPRRLTSRRRGLDEQELAETIEAVRMTSRDIELDLLLVEFHLVSGVRQEGALNLVLDGIDDRRCTVWLQEKYGKEREQLGPVPKCRSAALSRMLLSRRWVIPTPNGEAAAFWDSGSPRAMPRGRGTSGFHRDGRRLWAGRRCSGASRVSTRS
jgi:hypothetical protein